MYKQNRVYKWYHLTWNGCHYCYKPWARRLSGICKQENISNLLATTLSGICRLAILVILCHCVIQSPILPLGLFYIRLVVCCNHSGLDSIAFLNVHNANVLKVVSTQTRYMQKTKVNIIYR
jgi:hypothetical protein